LSDQTGGGRVSRYDANVIYDVDVILVACQVEEVDQPASINSVFHLPTLLLERAVFSRATPKRVRTRRLLLAATAAEMERVEYGRLTIEGIVQRAGVARGTFYLYFSNRSDAALAVRRTFMALMRHNRPRFGRGFSAYKTIWQVNRFYVACYARNAPILAGHEALMHDRPELARSRDELNHRWARVILRDLCRRTNAPLKFVDDPKAIFATRAVIAMADEVLRETYIYANPKLSHLNLSQEYVTNILSVLWYRSIYGHHPREADHILPVSNA
jgi:AcrR family transcriptional regulator